jgi:hypothetical protein
MRQQLSVALAMAGLLSLPLFAGTPGWRPPVGTSWQWQLDGTIDMSARAAIYDVDLFDVPASTVAALHAQGKRVICYMSAGSWENWRPDATAFPSVVIGRSNGWPGEKWLDIRRIDILGPIMSARMDLCKRKGFDGIEPDLVDGYTNNTGFPLTAADQLAYNKWLAAAAHARGLAVALKNDVEQVTELQPYFDFAIVEECLYYRECSGYTPFIKAGKAVLSAEYSGTFPALCRKLPAGFSGVKKRFSLDAWIQSCVPMR